MTLHTRMGLATGVLALVTAVLTTTGCTPPATHPNQLNEFDGATYDSLTLAHGALLPLRLSVSQDYPAYAPIFNSTAAAYNKAVIGYALYRKSQQDTDVSANIQDLTMAIVLLETTIQADLHVDPKQTANVRSSARQIRSRAAKQHISVSDILTELEIAASVAQTVLSTQPYSALAGVVIKATAGALEAEQACSGKPIDLTTLETIAPIVSK